MDQLGARVHEFAAMVSLPSLDGVGKIHAYKEGKYKDVPCFTMVDDASIGPEMVQRSAGGDSEDGVRGAGGNDGG